MLGPTHPFRSAFTRYGKYAARHVVSTLLISVLVAAILVYPFPFLYSTDFANGASNLPHHVWTDARPLEDKPGIEPDVIMRSIWVHGSYMQALEKDVLLGALELQDEILGPTANFSPSLAPGTVELPNSTSANLDLDLTPGQRDVFHVINGLTNQSWFFHSPLQYWSCSEDEITRDNDIIGTVNARKTQPTSVNVTLRHSIVFSGKRFEDRRLVAADALVITLIYLQDSPVGRMWEQRAKAITEKMADKWQLYTADEALSNKGQLYEFQFRPMSLQDGLALGLAYLLTLTYCLISLSKLRAVRSKVGLMVTVVVQIFFSMMSSFTICAIFKVDLSRIPSFSYPIAIFSLSLENVFRLINGVILTPSEDNTSSRIGHAFGETAHVCLAGVAQNLLVLYGLSKIVSPGVSAFCTFAAIAIVVDFFYLSTFFLAVLSVDVRRTELSDALAKASLRRSRRSSSDPQTRQKDWLDALLQGKVALSTRIAGTIVTVGFVLIAQWHFFENESVMRILGRILRISPKYKDVSTSRSSLLVDVHQARSPTSWLRLQDHETAREVIHVIKPDTHSYIARVFHPLIFVLKGSDRMPTTKERILPPAVYDFARHHSIHFIVTMLMIGAAVRLLMNYLLWDELAETTGLNGKDVPLLAVRTLDIGHALDVALLSASSDGHVVSVGLDRLVRVWDVKSGGESYVLTENDYSTIEFPVLAMCIDDESHWLALLTSDKILVWNLSERRWAPTVRIDANRQKPEAFLFYHDQSTTIAPLLIVRREGVMIEVHVDKGTSSRFSLAEESAIVSIGSLANKHSTKIMASTRDGQTYMISRKESNWNATVVDLPHVREREYLSTIALPGLACFLVIHAQSVDLVDSQSQKVVRSFDTDPIQPKTLRCFHSRPRRLESGSVGVRTLTFAYLNAYTRDLVVQMYTPQYEGESLCVCEPEKTEQSKVKNCHHWQSARETRRRINDPGLWEALPSRILVGVRRKRLGKSPPLTNPIYHQHQPHVAGNNGTLRRRRQGTGGHSTNSNGGSRASQHQSQHQQAQGDWEVWMFSQHGKQETWETVPLCPDAEDVRHLYVTTLGPMVRIGRSSIALGFSNVIKVIVVGQERFEPEPDDSHLGDGMPAVSSRRRKGAYGVRNNHSNNNNYNNSSNSSGGNIMPSVSDIR